MRRNAAVVALAATVAASCGSIGNPDFQVPITSPGGDSYTLLVYDDSGLVTGARSAPWDRAAPSNTAVAQPETQEVDINWTGGACHHQPTLEVSGQAMHLRLEVRNPSDPQWLPFLPIACPAVGVPLRIILSLSEPVQPIATDLEVIY
jgi:hypothetical protein